MSLRSFLRQPPVVGAVSFVLPGSGLVLLGRYRQGMAFIVASGVGLALCLVAIGFLLLPGIAVWSVILAVREAGGVSGPATPAAQPAR